MLSRCNEATCPSFQKARAMFKTHAEAVCFHYSLLFHWLMNCNLEQGQEYSTAWRRSPTTLHETQQSESLTR